MSAPELYDRARRLPEMPSSLMGDGALMPAYPFEFLLESGMRFAGAKPSRAQTFEISKTDGWKISSALSFRVASPCSNE